ncbi:DUF3000 domain-containing protein [Nostocoides australiense]|nr:DUF3000 domain-containing protein [Tetrasphaera sp.]
MATRSMTSSAPEDFARALTLLHSAALRPEIRLTEVPAPTRIAPHTVALTADVLADPHGEEELASGRFVLLHDPACPEPWGGAWRAVTFARAELEPEFATDPMLGEVGWAWLEEALTEHGLEFTCEAGTVTRVISEGFGAMAERPSTVEIEIRASWTPLDDEPGRHLSAWCDLLCTVAGLPPLPEGVVALPGRRR